MDRGWADWKVLKKIERARTELGDREAAKGWRPGFPLSGDESGKS